MAGKLLAPDTHEARRLCLDFPIWVLAVCNIAKGMTDSLLVNWPWKTSQSTMTITLTPESAKRCLQEQICKVSREPLSSDGACPDSVVFVVKLLLKSRKW